MNFQYVCEGVQKRRIWAGGRPGRPGANIKRESDGFAIGLGREDGDITTAARFREGPGAKIDSEFGSLSYVF